MLLVKPDAGSAGDALEEQRGLALAGAERLDEALLEIRVIVERQLFEDGRHRFAGRLGQGVAAAVVVGEPIRDDRTRHRLAPVTTHRTGLPADLDRQVEIRRNWLAAVITGNVRHANEKRRRSAFRVQGGGAV